MKLTRRERARIEEQLKYSIPRIESRSRGLTLEQHLSEQDDLFQQFLEAVKQPGFRMEWKNSWMQYN